MIYYKEYVRIYERELSSYEGSNEMNRMNKWKQDKIRIGKNTEQNYLYIEISKKKKKKKKKERKKERNNTAYKPHKQTKKSKKKINK